MVSGAANHPVWRRGAASKRLQEQGAHTPGRRKRARKYELIGEDWGMGSKDVREQLKEDNMAPQQEQEGALHTPYHTLQSAPYNTPPPPLEVASLLKEQQLLMGQGPVASVKFVGTADSSHSTTRYNRSWLTISFASITSKGGSRNCQWSGRA